MLLTSEPRIKWAAVNGKRGERVPLRASGSVTLQSSQRPYTWSARGEIRFTLPAGREPMDYAVPEEL